MARRKISNELWAVLQPLIPEFEHSPKGGRRRSVDDRAALNGILYVLQSGVPWEDLPQELGYGSGMTCWRRLRDWQAAGVWDRLHVAMLRRLREHDQIDWGRASIDDVVQVFPVVLRQPFVPHGPGESFGMALLHKSNVGTR